MSLLHGYVVETQQIHDCNIQVPNKTPSDYNKESESPASDQIWRKFSEKGFSERKSTDENLEQLIDSFRYSGLLSDEQSTNNTETPSSTEKNEKVQPVKVVSRSIRRAKSSASESSPNVSRKHNVSETRHPGSDQSKVPSSKPKKPKHRFKTFGRWKGMKIIKGIRRTPSTRDISDSSQIDFSLQQQQSLQTKSSNSDVGHADSSIDTTETG